MLRVHKAKSSRESIPLLRITSILIAVFICWEGRVIRVVKLAQPSLCTSGERLFMALSLALIQVVSLPQPFCAGQAKGFYDRLTHPHLYFLHY